VSMALASMRPQRGADALVMEPTRRQIAVRSESFRIEPIAVFLSVSYTTPLRRNRLSRNHAAIPPGPPAATKRDYNIASLKKAKLFAIQCVPLLDSLEWPRSSCRFRFFGIDSATVQRGQ